MQNGIPQRIMVLNDGETFTGLRGCKIVEIDPMHENADEIESSLKDETALTLQTFEGDEPRLTPELRKTVKDALEGDSNDAEHDALFYVAEALGIDFDVPED